MMDIRQLVEVKNGRHWEVSNEFTDELTIYKNLAGDLIAKKLNACTYIKTIKRHSNYDGTQTITVTYNNNCRSIYTVKN